MNVKMISTSHRSCDACVASCAQRATQASRLRIPPRAFSFAEVMFAVVILGIGFIMVAAVFPVAIQQTQNTGEENIAAALARQAANAISQMPTTLKNPIYPPTSTLQATQYPATTVQNELLFPPTVKNNVPGTDSNAAPAPSIVVPFVGNRWDAIKSNVILPNDPRYAYVAFYKRDNNSSAAQLIVIAAAIRNRSGYDSVKDLTNYYSGASPSITSTTNGDFPAAAGQTIICPDILTTGASAGEGYYFEIPPAAISPAPAGRSYVLGQLLSTGWELMPGDSMALTAGTNGSWGTKGRIADTPCAGVSAYLNPPATLQPTVAYAQVKASAASPYGQITLDLSSTAFTASNSNGPLPPPAAAQGAFVIIADDFPYVSTVVQPAGSSDYKLPHNVTGSAPYTVGAMNGHIFRLGTPVAGSPGVFNLDPAYGMRPGGTASPDTIPNPNLASPPVGNMPSGDLIGPWQQMCARVYIIGVGRTDPTVTNNATYSGPAQDIGAYTTYFQVQ